jgi:hypothetical protein
MAQPLQKKSDLSFSPMGSIPPRGTTTPRELPETGTYPLLDTILRMGVPATRESYIHAGWGDETPEEWGGKTSFSCRHFCARNKSAA